MIRIDTSAPVMVTGATGYVAGWIVKRLLDEGLTVHAAVRDPENEEKIRHLKELADNSDGEIKFFKADLLDEGSYAGAMEGCELVYHTASPFILHPKDAHRELVAPALNGTRNILNQVNATASVKKVVMTSSCAAIYGDNIDLRKTRDGKFTEEHWNTTSSLTHHPYPYSKTMAESEAWRIYREQNKWDLIVINPSFVMGPGIKPDGTSESFTVIKQMGDGTMSSGLPRWGMPVVDIRDLAEGHYRAGFSPDAEGRYIISGHNTSLMGMADALRSEFGKKYPLPEKTMPKLFVWLFGPMINPLLERKVIARNVNHPLIVDNSKSVKKLGMTYRPLNRTMVDFFQQMIDNNLIGK